MPLPYPTIPDTDFGFGTAYERVAFYELLEKWFREWQPKSGCEGFYDGFTGLPGLHMLALARLGGAVTVACPDEKQADRVQSIYRGSGLSDRLQVVTATEPSQLTGQTFDVVILFNPFPYRDDWREFLQAAASIARDRLIVSVANRDSYGALFRRVQKNLRPSGKVDLFDHPATDPKIMRAELERYGHVEIEDFFDAPWWPDLFVDAGDSIVSWVMKSVFGLKPKPRPAAPKPEGAWSFGAGSYPYFTADDTIRTGLAAKITTHPTFDRWPKGVVKRFFGHHRIFVVQRRPNA